MAALPDWVDLLNVLGAGECEAPPEDICRRIEVADGDIIVDAPPRAVSKGK
jgi:hypothetical protein